MELDHLLVSKKARKGGIEERTEWQRWGGREEEMKKNSKNNSFTTGLPEIFV